MASSSVTALCLSAWVRGSGSPWQSTAGFSSCRSTWIVSDGQAHYHFGGQSARWPRLVDGGRTTGWEFFLKFF
jgi:hypothetical protein